MLACPGSIGLLSLRRRRAVCGPGVQRSAGARHLSANHGLRGTVWNVTPLGMLTINMNNFANQVGTLAVNNMNFTAQQSQMRADQSEYILSGVCGTVQVVRRIKFDTANSTTRYLEILSNVGPTDLPAVQVTVWASVQVLGNYFSDVGAVSPASLESKASSVVLNRFDQSPSLAWWLASPERKSSPAQYPGSIASIERHLQCEPAARS